MKLRFFITALACLLTLSFALPANAAPSADEGITDSTYELLFDEFEDDGVIQGNPLVVSLEDGTPVDDSSNGTPVDDVSVSDTPDDVDEPDDVVEPPVEPPVYDNIPDENTLSCAQFIKDERRREYIDRMLGWYIGSNTELRATLENGLPVVVFFEGGSDKADEEPYRSNISYRDSAACFVLRQDSPTASPRIVYCCTNCTTLPDYPYSYDYPNGHEDYGTATVLDGVYNLYTVNHKDTYAGFNVRVGVSGKVPSLYMKRDGTFANLNATGINVHTRIKDQVSTSQLKPRSAGCLMVGDAMPYDEYNAFIEAAAPKNSATYFTPFNNLPIRRYSSGIGIKAGMLVLDRYLARTEMMRIYKNNTAAIEYITSYSASCQADSHSYLARCTYYPAHLTVSAPKDTPLRSLPTDDGSISTVEGKTDGSRLNVSALYKNSRGECWYRVILGVSTYYVRASETSGTTLLYDDVSIIDEQSPDVKQFGKSYSLKGIIVSNENLITSVTGTIYNANGSVNCTATDTGRFHNYDITWPSVIDDNMEFGKMPVGQYRYKLSAEVDNYYCSDGKPVCEHKTITLVDKPIRVAAYVTFNANGGSVDPAGAFANASNRLDSLPVPKNGSMYFDGWYDKAEGGSKIAVDKVYTANATIYAHWASSFVKTNSSRISGSDRYATAVKISSTGWKSAKTVIIASGENYPDALAGAPLSKKLDAPVLLTAKKSISADVLNEIKRLGASEALILGGPGAVSSSVENSLLKAGVSVSRIFGDTRNGTASDIAANLNSTGGTAFLVSNAGFADALAASPVAALTGAPILYLNTNGSIPAETAEALSRMSCKKAYIFGGKNAIADKAETNLERLGISATRISGADRYATGVAIYDRFKSTFAPGSMFIATGKAYPDALAGAALAAKRGLPVLLVGDSASSGLLSRVKDAQIENLYILGGEKAVSASVEKKLKA